MKKLLLILSISLTAFNLFANENKNAGSNPDREVVLAFREDFPNARNIKWQIKEFLYVISFDNNGRRQVACYNKAGIFIGQGWAVQFKDLPSEPQRSILRNRNISDVKSVFLLFPAEGFPVYYAEIESEGKKKMLEVDSYGKSALVLKKRIPVF